jgi:hypothetical protein
MPAGASMSRQLGTNGGSVTIQSSGMADVARESIGAASRVLHAAGALRKDEWLVEPGLIYSGIGSHATKGQSLD